ncbi:MULTISPECIES: sensor histidine kinase [Methylosinus]|uniref:histidine kinase n=1 Tax=Methylosinus trichosporium (strain ATCC 35070 / NCIMB 11131 / UNIQEM 75 / OB3b) TaxID=595536 RepID=A0A2D2D1B7_METT3|nr:MULTISPECIES: HAMP domain-containing sensor histidine kinase [Methylosinus]ATQ68795.1 sensor histidine kinase [Methylosinus trichosporium OB3b]OBS51658.1 two-component sensor histidine kinase [Methylosinus sp. 3S-1]
MTTAPSLVRRTVGYLVLSQLLAYLIGWGVPILLGLLDIGQYAISYDELASARAEMLIQSSLVRGSDDIVRIDPAPGLAEEARRNPRFKYAVFDFVTGAPIPGSSPELVATLAKIIDISSEHAHFVLPGDPRSPALGFMATSWTRYGKMHIAHYCLQVRPIDALLQSIANFEWYWSYVGAAMATSVLAAFIAVRRGLQPLRATMEEAARIDMNSLDQRLATNNVPIEITPLVDAVNEALSRLAAGVARQRRFTANAAHELRTPLAIMRARLENARETALNNELLVDASQLRSIVEQMLMAARIAEGQVSLDEDVDLCATTREVVTNMLPLAMDVDRFIDFEESGAPVIVRGNRRAIESIVANLIDNALRAEPAGGTVIARVLADAGIEVIDHGAGVAESDRELIFEPFWRKSEATPGTGLGLSIARELMEAHHGRILVETTPGGGATFKIWFPVALSAR